MNIIDVKLNDQIPEHSPDPQFISNFYWYIFGTNQKKTGLAKSPNPFTFPACAVFVRVLKPANAGGCVPDRIAIPKQVGRSRHDQSHCSPGNSVGSKQ